MKGVCFLAVVLFCRDAFAGLGVAIENDVFVGSDDNYSHGTEIEWSNLVKNMTGGTYRVGYGAHQTMYTPHDITISENQPDERPWCGMLTVYRETRSMAGVELVRSRIEAGVLGSAARSEETQKWFHRVIGDDEPMGWDNQMSNEPAINWYSERYHPLWSFGDASRWSEKMEAVYGGTFGTTFINVQGGVVAKAGYNIPPLVMESGIDPKAVRSDFFVYLIVDTDGMIVFHNATFGDSFFRDREPGHEQDLEHCVGMYRYGISLGYRMVSLTCLIGQRSSEFKGETDGGMGWGLIRLEFGF